MCEGKTMKLFGRILKKELTFSRIPLGRLSVWVALLVLPGLFLAGCYGDFALTKALYDFNGGISPNPFIQSCVMWVLGFFFIYSIAVFLDVVIFNLIEFWTGDNPMMMSKTIEAPDGSQVVMTPLEDGNTVQVDVVREGEVVESRSVRKASEGNFEIVDDQGAQVGGVKRLENGDLELSRPGTTETRVLPKQALEDYRRQAEMAYAN
jgi:hypothetical protein